MARRALVFNLNPDPSDGEESASFANRGLDDNWADAEPDPRRALADHASVAAADDVRLLARLLRALGYAVSCPLIPRSKTDMAEMIRSTKRDALKSGLSSSDAAAAATATDEEPCVIVMIAGAHFQDESEDGALRFVLPPDPSTGVDLPAVIDTTEVQGWLDEEFHALPGDPNPLEQPSQVGSLLIVDLASTSSSAFRAHVDDRDNHRQANRACHVLSSVHFVMYSSGETLLSLVSLSFAACLAGSTQTAAGLAKDVCRRAERLTHFAGPVFDGISEKPLTIVHNSATPSLPGSPGGLQHRHHERFDATVTLRVKQPQEVRVIDDLAEMVLRISEMQTIKVTGVEWEVITRLDTESADESTVRQETARHLAMIWQCSEATANDDIVVMVSDNYREGTLVAKHRDSRPAKLVIRQLTRSEDPCLGPFAVFSSSVAVEVAVRASTHGLVSLFAVVRQVQFGHALDLDPASGSLMWTPSGNEASGNDLLSRPSSAWRAGSATPTAAAASRPGTSETAMLASNAEQQVIVAPLLQRLGRGYLTRRVEVWKNSGVPRDVGLMRIALLSERRDSVQRLLDMDDMSPDDAATALPPSSKGACLNWLLHDCMGSPSAFWLVFLVSAEVLALLLRLLFALCLAHILEAMRVPQGPGPSPLFVLVARLACITVLFLVADLWGRTASGVVAARSCDEFEKGLAKPVGRLKARWRRGSLSPLALSRFAAEMLQASGHLLLLISCTARLLAYPAVGATLVASSSATSSWQAYVALYVAALCAIVAVVGLLGTVPQTLQQLGITAVVASATAAWLCSWLETAPVGHILVFSTLAVHQGSTWGYHAAHLWRTSGSTAFAVELILLRQRCLQEAVLVVHTMNHQAAAYLHREHSSSGTSDLNGSNSPPVDYSLPSSRMSLSRRLLSVTAVLVVLLVGVGFVATPISLYSATLTCPRNIVYCSAVSNVTGNVLVSQHAIEGLRDPTWSQGCETSNSLESWLSYCDNLAGLSANWRPALLGSTSHVSTAASGFETPVGLMMSLDAVWQVAVLP